MDPLPSEEKKSELNVIQRTNWEIKGIIRLALLLLFLLLLFITHLLLDNSPKSHKKHAYGPPIAVPFQRPATCIEIIIMFGKKRWGGRGTAFCNHFGVLVIGLYVWLSLPHSQRQYIIYALVFISHHTNN